MKEQYIYHFIVWASLLATLIGCSYSEEDNTTLTYQEGIDISHHNGVIDWSQLTKQNSGKTFVIVKATEGVTYQDPKFVENIANASSSGFQVGAYHFLIFDSSTAAEDQMKNFLSQIDEAIKAGVGKLDKKQLIIALDVEENCHCKNPDYNLVSNVVEECVRYLKKQDIVPYIYTTQYFWNSYVETTPDIVKACPLWIARYRLKAPSSNELPNGWQDWKIWQYASDGSVSGIKGQVDLNKMK